MESHLNDDQIEELLRPARAQGQESALDRDAQEMARAHLQVCGICHARVLDQQSAMERLVMLRADAPMAPTPHCPPDNLWIEVAGRMPAQDSEGFLSHAATCDHCGPLLQQAVADLAMELTSEENNTISNLPSSTEMWQKTLAEKLSKVGSVNAGDAPRNKWQSPRRAFLLSPARLTFALSAVGLIAIGVWITVQKAQNRTPEQLIADAYAEKRVMEVRIEGAPYVPLRQERGPDSGNRMSRPALLKAEAEIATRLQTRPDDIRWLQASGRASMMEGDQAGVDAALTTLKKAERLAPDDVSIQVDLASSYLLRGQYLNRPEDVGLAVETLGRVLSSRKADEAAYFNYAVALEKLLLKQQAKAAWQVFVAKYPKSPWVHEAQDRLMRLQKEIDDHQSRSDAPLKTLPQIAAAFQSHDAAQIAQIDSRIEEYQDLVLQDWLPEVITGNKVKDSSFKMANVALSGLSQILAERHQDFWLRDLMISTPNTRSKAQAVSMLAAAASHVETPSDFEAQRDAQGALVLFRKLDIPAGVLRAQLILTLLEQYEHGSERCEKSAQAMKRDPSLAKYAWIEIQANIEDSFCASVSDQHARDALQLAMQSTKSHRYPILALRATVAETSLYSTLGDDHQAWKVAWNGLESYWGGAFPELRGYNAVVSFDEINYPQGRWFLEAAILREALPMIAGDSRTTMLAVEQARLGQTLMEEGDYGGAETTYREANALISESTPGVQKTTLSAEIELGIANVEMHRNQLDSSLIRLNGIRPILARISDDFLALDFYKAAGIAELRLGQVADAQNDLDSGIRLAEMGLCLVANERDRLLWSRQNESLYRAEVELSLRSDPTKAFAQWEWYKGAALRERACGSARQPKDEHTYIDRRPSLPHPPSGALLISYFFTSHGYTVWAYDKTGVRELSVPVELSELSILIQNFEEHCSDPHSNYDDLERESHRLYGFVISPIEPWLAGHTLLTFEPDGPLRAVPMELLLGSKTEFLGDRYAVTSSPGVDYLDSARKWTRVSPDSDALLIGSPDAPGWMPLPDAQSEVQEIASQFRHPILALGKSVPKSDLSAEIERAELIHFSGHSRNSTQSTGLVLGGLGADGTLNLEPVAHGRAKLVVLSACSSSDGTRGMFDDEDSLARRLIGTRVPVVVASRWNVDSASTALLMKGFYRALLSGKQPCEALWAATRGLRAQPGLSHPFYWGGFSVFGAD